MLKNSSGKIWVNVASSTHTLDEFINLDNHVFLLLAKFERAAKVLMPRKYHGVLGMYAEVSRRNIVVRHDCRKPLPFADGSVDHILCSHFLEHVYRDEARQILGDYYRALKSGGSLHVVVPDLHPQAREYLRQHESGVASAADEFVDETLLTRRERGTLKYRLLEFHGGFGLQHRYMYDLHSMQALVVASGFQVSPTNETPSKRYRQGDGSVHVVGYKPTGQ